MKKIILTFLLTALAIPHIAFAQINLFQGGTGWSTSTKGDLLVGTSTGLRYSRLPVGANNRVLVASSTSPFGLEWVATSTLGFGSGGSVNYWSLGSGFLSPSTTTDYVRASFFVASSTTATSSFPNASTTNLTILGKLFDRLLSAGTNGQILQTNGTGVTWVATSSLGISGGSGTVTSVDMTVPTGLSISGNPITTSGTLALTLTGGYVIPLTASTTEWSRAYGSTTALTPSYIRGLFSNSSTGLTYNSTTGDTSLTAGYIIPLIASTTQWNTAFASTTALTPAYIRGLFSNTATGLTYSNGVTSLTGGYVIPLIASTTEWATAYASTTALTPAYFRGLLSGTSPITFNSGTGAIGFDFSTNNTWTGGNVFGNASSTRHFATTSLAINSSSTNNTVSGILYLPALSNGCLEVSSGIVTSTGSNCGTGGGGITSLNGLTGSSQTLATSTGGTLFTISSSGTVHTFNFPTSPTFSTTTMNALIADEIFARTSAGLILRASNGTPVADFGIGNSANATIFGGLNVNNNVQASMFIASSTTGTSTFAGRVGIGTTTPVTRLTVGQIPSATASFISSNTDAISVGSNGNSTILTMVYGGASSPTAGAFGVFYQDDGAAMASGDRLGGFAFGGNTGSTMNNSAAMEAFAEQNWSGTAAGSFLRFSTTNLAETTRVERMRITAAGLVGIGSSTPTARLTVQGTTSAPTTDVLNIASSTNASMFIVKSSGNVGISTSSPSHLLTVAGDMNLTGALRASGVAGTLGQVLQTTGSGVQWVSTSSLGISGGSGTVTSVAQTVPTGFTISGSPVTTSGTLAIAYDTGYEGLKTASSTQWNQAYASTTALTPTYIRGLFSNTATGLTYNGTTGATSLTAGYVIPLTASTTEWAQASASTTALTPSYIRNLFTNTATGLTYSNGATSLTAGYIIPLIASTTEWATAYASTTALTPAYFRGLLSGTSPITFNSGTGAIGFDYSTNNSWTGGNTFVNATTTRLFSTTTIGINASTTNQTIAGALYLPLSDGCLQVSGTLVSSTGTACGSGSGGSNWTVGSNFLRVSTTTDYAQAAYWVASSTTASVFPNASTTNVTVGSNLYLSSQPNGCLQISGTLITSTGTSCGTGGGGSNWIVGSDFIRTATSTDYAQAAYWIASSTTATSTFYGALGIGTSTSLYKFDVLGDTRLNSLVVGTSTSQFKRQTGAGSLVAGYFATATGSNMYINAPGSGSLAYGTGKTSDESKTIFISAVGPGSHASGNVYSGALSSSTIEASGSGAFAGGNSSGRIQASGDGSFAFGNVTGGFGGEAIISSGLGSFAFGIAQSFGKVEATGNGSFAFGQSVRASGDQSVAIGDGVTATGTASFALGGNFTNNRNASFQVGYSSTPTLTVNSTGLGIATTSPNVPMLVHINSPAADAIVFRVTTSADASRFSVDEDGDVTFDGLLSAGTDVLANGGDVYQGTGDLFLKAEDNMSFTMDYAGNDTTSVMRWGRDVGLGVNPSGTTSLMQLDQLGHLTIGTTTSFARLSVQGTPGTTIPLFAVASTTTSNFATTSLFIVGSNGTVGIGSSTPAGKLGVVGSVFLNGLSTGTAGNAVCINANKEIVDAGGTTCTTSSERFKSNIDDLKNSLNIVTKMRPVSFTRNEPSQSQPDGKEIGFIAEEVNEIDKRLVEYEADGITPRGVNYQAYTAHLTGAIQALNEKIDNLDPLVADTKKKTTDNAQWIIIVILLGFVIRQQLQINKLK